MRPFSRISRARVLCSDMAGSTNWMLLLALSIAGFIVYKAFFTIKFENVVSIDDAAFGKEVIRKEDAPALVWFYDKLNSKISRSNLKAL